MATTGTTRAKGLPRNRTKELDIYAAEFAKLVDRHSPSRSDTPSEWLRRLPDEAYRYYQEGVSTFGSEARSPIERRGRLYLIHTSLLFMWMSWGKKTARECFQTQANEGTRRAASLVTIEHYRRAGVLANYETNHWFNQPASQWTVALISGAVRLDRVPAGELTEAIQRQTTVRCSVRRFARLRRQGALPSRSALSLDSPGDESS
jgi:hypothetical protein